MLELLAPAGSPEHLRAAVENGANAVYLGCGAFNARRRARNFTPQELEEAVSYCHLRGVKVYLTLNTLVSQRELPAALETGALANRVGVDAVLVQDVGLAAGLAAAFPDLPLHASTQMTVHSLDGVLFCARLGMKRVVLSRELTGEAIAHICAHSPVEIEVFGHGALCMSYSGQCCLSSLIGGRSGNRGLCAQPCRLPCRPIGGCGHPLSLKDMSLAGHLRELEDMGVASLKLEGRMKRPEYVAIVTRVYADALRERRSPTDDELRRLEAAFSRSGFTDGYFTGRTGPRMFGVREDRGEREEDAALFLRARESYQKPQPLVPVTASVTLAPGHPLTATLSDGVHTVSASGPVPAPARTRPLTQADLLSQFSKTGGTPWRLTELKATAAPGLSLPLSALNALRRALFDLLAQRRLARPPRRALPPPPPPVAGPGPAEPQPVFTLRAPSQLTAALWRLPHARIDLPPAAFLAAPHQVSAALSAGAVLSVALPRVVWDRERPALLDDLRAIRDMGVTHALVPTWDLLPLARSLGFALHGDFGLGVYNAASLAVLADLGFLSATLSFEQRLSALRDLPKVLPCEAIVYGRLPLMYLQQPPAGASPQPLVDRRGARFPVLPAFGGRAELFNCKPLCLSDKTDWHGCGLTYARFLFTTESPEECLDVLARYRDRSPASGDFTRGLYYRDVE